MKVAYIVSRFPHVSETFIVRELNAVSAAGIEIELFSLFAPVDPTVHPSAAPWIPKLHRGRLARGLAAFAWWMLRRPLRLSGERRDRLRRLRPPARPRPARARDAGDRVRPRAHAPRAAGRPRPRPLRHLSGARRVAVPSTGRDPVQLHRACSRPVRRLLDAPAEGRRRRLRGHDLGVQPSLDQRARPGRDPDPRRPRRDRPRRLRVPVAESRAGEPVAALCVASLQEYKGHAVLLRALASDPRLERVRLELIGGGELRPELERLAAELGIAERVTFAGALRRGGRARAASRPPTCSCSRASSPPTGRWRACRWR